MSYGYCIDTVIAAYNAVGVQCDSAETYMEQAYTKADWAAAKIPMNSCIGMLVNAIKNVRGGYGCGDTTYGTTSSLVKLRDLASNGEVEVTMNSILSAMITANDEDIEYFIGLVDAYRQAIWNKPFNYEFFAALARGFEG